MNDDDSQWKDYCSMLPSCVKRMPGWKRGLGGPARVLLAMVLGGICLQFYYNSSKYDTYKPAPRYDSPQETNASSQLWWREVMCNITAHWTDKPEIPLRRLFRDVTPEKDNDVFLMDTACNSRPKYRVWCSVESWAMQNPTRQVWFLLVSGKLAEAELPRVLLQNYANLHVVGADLDDLFRDTPLLAFFNSRKWKDTWPVNQLSNMLRVLVLWWWGGVYSDTDMISIRPLTLPPNAVGFAHRSLVNNAFLSFRAHHPILLELMNEMPKTFKPKKWGTIGPTAITNVARRACRKNLTLVAEKVPEECPGNFTLYPHHTFNPIPYPSYEKFFKRGGGKDFHKMFNETFTLHFWNKMSKDAVVKVNSNSIYEVAARNFCPFTFQMATADSDTF